VPVNLIDTLGGQVECYTGKDSTNQVEQYDQAQKAAENRLLLIYPVCGFLSR
jgi:hypothetical protein